MTYNPFKFTFSWGGNTKQQVRQWFDSLSQTYKLRLLRKLNTLAKQVQAEMVKEAPWQDRTGHARASLRAEAIVDNIRDAIVFKLYYQDTPYDIYLESMQAGAFAIVGPTFEKYRDQILKAATEALKDKDLAPVLRRQTFRPGHKPDGD